MKPGSLRLCFQKRSHTDSEVKIAFIIAQKEIM